MPAKSCFESIHASKPPNINRYKADVLLACSSGLTVASRLFRLSHSRRVHDALSAESLSLVRGLTAYADRPFTSALQFEPDGGHTAESCHHHHTSRAPSCTLRELLAWLVIVPKAVLVD